MEYAIDKSMDVVVNGDTQNIRIRAERKGLPVILFIHGGPGVCDRHFVLDNQSSLAHDFTMGAGISAVQARATAKTSKSKSCPSRPTATTPRR